MSPNLILGIGYALAALGFFGCRGPAVGAAILAGVFAWIHPEVAAPGTGVILAALTGWKLLTQSKRAPPKNPEILDLTLKDGVWQ